MVRLVQVFLIACLVVMIQWAAPKIDGLFFPVITDLTLEAKLDPENGRSTLVGGEYTRTRNCDFIRTDWFYGRPGARSIGLTAVRVEPLLEIPGPGRHAWGPTRLFIDPVQIKNNVYAIAVHDCYRGLLWETETLIYNSTPVVIPNGADQ